MLKSRVVTASVLITFVLWIIFAASAMVFFLFVVLVSGLAAWEWNRLIPQHCEIPKVISKTIPKNSSSRKERFLAACRIKQTYWRCVYVFFIEIVLIGGYQYYSEINSAYYYLSIINGVFLILATVAIVTYPKTQKYWHSAPAVAIFGIFLLITAGFSLLLLKNMSHGVEWLLTLLFLTWAADTGAYFSGRLWGRRKFLPHVSPNKTWAGFWGGFLLSEIVIIVAGYKFAAEILGWNDWIAIGTLTLFGAVIGDLLISLLKRCVNLKDTGNMLPGHGGILDRVDSLLVSSAVLAFFLVGKL